MRAIALTGMLALLAGCASTDLEQKIADLEAKASSLEHCETRVKWDAEICAKQKAEADAKAKELDVFRQKAELSQKQLDTMAEQENQLRQKLQKELADKNVEIEQLKGQLSVRMLDRIVFKSGSADLLPQGLIVLDKLADVLKAGNDALRVEGHTDATPIGAALQQKFPSNWELSGARAASVVRYFETKHAIDPKRLEPVGYSSHRPVAANDTDENKQRNRRVEIILKPVPDAS
jgi:chemotaxis protein MotB